MSLSTLGKDLFTTKDGLMLTASVVLFAGGIGAIVNVIRRNKRFQVSNETRTCLKTSAGYAFGIWGLATIPTFVVRKVGWDNVSSFYKGVLFRNPYTSILSIALPTILAVYTLLLPSQEKALKQKCVVASSLVIGTVAAPLFFRPNDYVTIAGCYTAGISVPLITSMCFSSDLVMHNVISMVLMTMGTVFSYNNLIPFILKRRHADNQLRYYASHSAKNLILSCVFFSAFFALLISNSQVVFVEKSFNAKKLKDQQQGNGKKGNKQQLQKKEKGEWWSALVDGTDEITNGILMSVSVLYTFAILLIKTFKLAKKVATEGKKAVTKNDQENILDNLLSSFLG